MRDLIVFLAMPFTFTLLLVVFGFFIRWRHGARKSGNACMVAGVLLLWFFSSGLGSSLLLSPLENAYEPLLSIDDPTIEYVVVLGGGHHPVASLPSTTQINSGSLHRLMEGVRLHRQLPDSRLILMGGVGEHGSYTSELMGRLLEETGIDQDNITLARGAWNTEAEAEQVAELLGEERRLVLVTSARHMPRAMGLFYALGLEPVAAPTQHEVRTEFVGPLWYLSWSPGKLNNSHQAVHEYLGILWSWLRGHFQG